MRLFTHHFLGFLVLVGLIGEARAQISDFSAAHLPSSQDVEIVFQVGKSASFVPAGTPVFSISLDGGNTYVDTVKTFDPKAGPGTQVAIGLNRYIWKAAIDHPNTYVDPAFIRMRMNVTRNVTPHFQYQSGSKPAIKVNTAAPAFEVVKYIAGVTLTDYASSLETVIQPGVYVGSDLKDLVAKIDPNAWSPPPKDDILPTVSGTPSKQDGIAFPVATRDGFKFAGEPIVYNGLPEVSPGKPIVATDNPRETKPVTDVDAPQSAKQESDTRISLRVRFDLFQGVVTFANASSVQGLTGPNFKSATDIFVPEDVRNTSAALPPQNPSTLPREPGIGLGSERGTIWGRGDYLIGIIGANGIVDLVVISDPTWEHQSDGGEHHSMLPVLQSSLGAQFDLRSDFQRIVVWRAVFSNRELPMEELVQFTRYFPGYLEEVLSVDAAAVKKAQAAPAKPLAAHGPVNANPQLERLWRGGSKNQKYNVVITGDGFADTEEDNQKIRNWLTNVLMNQFTQADAQPSFLNAVNFLYFDAKSRDSGITQTIRTNIGQTNLARFQSLTNFYLSKADGSNPTNVNVYLVNGPLKNTAWGFASAGWEACWNLSLTGWRPVIDAVTAAFDRTPDEVWLVANTPTGGCKSSVDGVTCVFIALDGAASVSLHEFGHSFGKLGDEYSQEVPYPSPKGRASRATVNLFEVNSWDQTLPGVRAEWQKWIPGWRPLPTMDTNVVLRDTDVGLFLGAHYATNGIYRPAVNSRMRTSSKLHSPVGITEMRKRAATFREQDLRRNQILDANNDGKADLIVQDDRQVGLFLSADRSVGPADPARGSPPRAVSCVLEPRWFVTDMLKTGERSWEFRAGDRHVVCDFNRDGNQDLFVHNPETWAMPYIGILRSTGQSFEVVKRYDSSLTGWAMRTGDVVRSADFDGDGFKDWLAIFNGTDWQFPQLGIYRVDASNRLELVERFDRFLPGWEMGRRERFEFIDINGDGADDIVAINQTDWNRVHIHIYVSLRNGQFALSDRFNGQISTGIVWNLNRRDQYLLGDWNGDGVTDFGIFNGKAWDTEYLGLFQFNRQGKLASLNLLSNAITGWDFQPDDVIKPFDRDGNGVSDFVVLNTLDWGNHQFLGILSNDGKGNLLGRHQRDWIGGWHLGEVDDFKVCDFGGGSGWEDLFIFNKEWFGLLRGQALRFSMDSIYYRWIDNQRYHANGLY